MFATCTPQLVMTILENKIGVSASTPNVETASWDELGVESLGLTELCASLESQLGHELPHARILQSQNLTELVQMVNALLV